MRGHEGRGTAVMQANGANQRWGAVTAGFDRLFARDEGNLPLPEPIKTTMLASRSPGNRRLSVTSFVK